MSEPCTWCGAAVDPWDGFRAYELAGGRRAVFCRLEHVIPWAIRGAYWEPLPGDAEGVRDGLTHCAWCERELTPEDHVAVVRNRGEHRIPDGFCGVAHLLEWAKAGGRYRT